ncbi:alpha/beta-hydrolase [Pleomassaria siparia CBS 279.74]|uniref:Alpha/beta-hydrolase n=1 Tax=Pleomassaria siparia CBS 279.74 TaxID=1314801 RepID=A0A6G1K873_9PLEO|nr:alpha/beta-hydrolase [Pleomassaria siparia CBS 279.74]
MSSSFNIVPDTAKRQPQPFELHVDEGKLHDLKTLLRLSPVGRDAYENQEERAGKYGVSRAWLLDAKAVWERDFDWRKQEGYINSFPNYTAAVTDDTHTFTIHFVALFSRNPRAIPLALFHGWPGSFLEFLPILSLLRDKYTPETLPYHIIVPSLPGYTLSSPPPLDRDWQIADTARVMHRLLLSLGFDKYVVQGGDIGSYVSRTMAVTYPECLGVHLNFCMMPEPAPGGLHVTELEAKGLKRLDEFMQTGLSYGQMHAHRPATIGHVLSASPVALLAWIGEKFSQWSDPAHPLPLETVLADVTLYWLTECFSTCIHTYRQDFAVPPTKGYFHGQEGLYIKKPMGYSYFSWELGPVPKSWAETSGELVWFKAHERGGHFAALERPRELLEDVEAFLAMEWLQKEG